MTRLDSLGVISIIRALSIHPGKYGSLTHFFRFTAFSLQPLKQAWHHLVQKDGRLYTLNGRPLLIGDGIKQPKEGRHMSGVKKLFQESEDSSKPAYIFGHMYGGVVAVIHREDQYFAAPLDLNIQDGLAEISLWNQGSLLRSDSHVVQMIRNGHEAASSFDPSYMALDRYFLTVPALEKLNALNQEKPLLHIITRAKASCVAYELPPVSDTPHRGRPRKKGDSVKLNTHFESRAFEFTRAEAMAYGKKRKWNMGLPESSQYAQGDKAKAAVYHMVRQLTGYDLRTLENKNGRFYTSSGKDLWEVLSERYKTMAENGEAGSFRLDDYYDYYRRIAKDGWNRGSDANLTIEYKNGSLYDVDLYK